MNRPQPQNSPEALCQRNVDGAPCTDGAQGGPAPAVGQVGGRWYCRRHIAAAKAVARKRRDRGFGTCSVPGCSRPAAERDGKCDEHRAGERAAGATVVVVDDGSGRGDHPYAPKRTEIYLAVFFELGFLKVGKATPWTVESRVKDAAAKLRLRRAEDGVEYPVNCEPMAWKVSLFGGESVLWSVSERVEHAAAGRLAYNVGAASVEHTHGKEWLSHRSIGDIDWRTEFHRAIGETLVFLGHDEAKAGEPRRVGEPQGLVSTSPAEITEPQAPPAQGSNLKPPPGTVP